ncbi:Uma2 family endonuclease [Acaryochloris sp. CCMEE 5410]|uniref:Uma2 family endonuclease n=1 Tax=Acaryochloris sp. CCMEE 5410 TaxID=310037 RepID=UPI0002484D8B|nr:Uma2 family endonuclease [Acaryochloris sp. CCMEE 5410]KAI9130564.1 Uma2 family endonuclease [Acaryochloris sp. CCMEE 5410]
MQTQLPVTETTQTSSAEQRLTLSNVSWETYEKLLNAFGEHRAVRLHYDEGVLEFMVPLEAHENPSDIIGAFIRRLVVDSGCDIKSMASTTLRRNELQKGAEPDKCFYIQNESKVRGREVDLDQDPPPDLVVEVDITHTDIDKNRLYAQLGVPELWRFNGQSLTIYQLQGEQYQEVEQSRSLPWINKALFYDYLNTCKSMGEAQALRQLSAWITTHLPQ